MEEVPRSRHMRGMHQETEKAGTSDDMVGIRVNGRRIVRTNAAIENITLVGDQMKENPHGIQSTTVVNALENDQSQGPGPIRAPLRLHPVGTARVQSATRDVAPPAGNREAHQKPTKGVKLGTHHEQEQGDRSRLRMSPTH